MESLITIPDLMERLKIGRTVTYRLIRSGELPSVKEGRARRVSATALDAYINALPG